MRNDLWRDYLWQDYDALARSGLLRSEILEALHLHWSMQIADAFSSFKKIVENIPESELSELEITFITVEMDMLAAKLGLTLGEEKIADTHWVPQLFRSYARFTHYFWIDHDISWIHLWRFFYQALRGRSVVVLAALFLMGHMRCINGKRFSGAVLAGLVWHICIRLINAAVKLPPVTTKMVMAAYPYTMFVSGRPLAVRSYAEKYGHLVTTDPFYQTVYQVSCFYAFAYSGDVVRTEMYAAKFKILHRNNKLLRYNPVTEILPMLPMALRGYGFVIDPKFNRLVDAHDESTTDPVVNFQFYHAAAIIELSMMRYDSARKHIERAIFFREKSGSFQAWAKVDDRIRELAINKTPFDPQKNRLLGSHMQFDSAHGLSKFFLQLTAELPKFAENPDLFVSYIANYLQNHLGDCKVTVAEDISSTDIVQKICVVARNKYIVITADKDRLGVVSAMVETISPAVVAVESTISEMESLHKNLEESSKLAAIARTTQTIAHDVRRPFTQIKMGLEVLRRKELEPSTRDFVELLSQKVDGSYQHVNAMLDDILNIGRRYDINSSVVDLHALIDDIVENTCLELQVDQKRCNLKLEHDLAVRGDEHHLRRVLTNLVANAIEAMGTEGELTVTARRRYLDDGDMIEVVVHNSHSYIPPDEREKIFEPFYTRGKHLGTGLGLAIAKQILQAHGARIDCHSNEQTGTQFVMNFVGVESDNQLGENLAKINCKADSNLANESVKRAFNASRS